ncbi:MAG: T9SS type A sorting domain-containing protein, partial [Bacteroidales bacterium]|nr:T9SS type A sorting domain-containing protein [Bacteroidales bacterium]
GGGNGGDWFLIQNQAFGENLVSTNGAKGFDLSTSTAQNAQWKKENADNGWFYLTNRQYNERLKSNDGAKKFDLTTQAGAKLIWKEEDAGGDYVYLVNKKYNERLKALNSAGGLELATNTGNKAMWKFIAAPKSMEEPGEYLIARRLRVFPNPAINAVTILMENKESAKYFIFNVSGQMVNQGMIYEGSAKIDVSEVEPGMYILFVTTGSEMLRQQLIIE